MYDEKSGKTFVVYKGTEIDIKKIYDLLRYKCPPGYKVNYKAGDNLIFAKIVYASYAEDRDPKWDNYNGILTVNGYNQDEIKTANEELSVYSIEDPDKYHYITNLMYIDIGTNLFKELKKYMHFCTVIWDRNDDLLIAGITEPNNEYTHLYYGYTKIKKELMFSNDKSILENFCDEIIEMSKNTYMKNGELYGLDGNKIEKSSNPTLIEKTRQNADFLIDGLNDLLVKITDNAIRSKIEKNIEQYLYSENTKKKIDNYVHTELDGETKKQILLIIKNAIQEFSLENEIENKLNDLFANKFAEYANTVNLPVTHVIKLNDTILGQTSGGFYHEKFEELLQLVQLDEPIMLIGPAGSGKNFSIAQIAQALGLHMYYTNNASNEFKLTGFIDAGGNYRDTEFYKAFKNGGIFFLDEIDNSDPSALIVINSALANGYMAFPHETIDRHPDFRMVSAANTWGKGSDLQYVGRNALDGATLDRFDNIFFDYDPKLEEALYPNNEVLQFMWSFRDAVYQTKIPHIVSTRGIGKVYKKEINGVPLETILRVNIVKNLSQDDLNTIMANMDNISSSNKFYEGIKRLRLER